MTQTELLSVNEAAAIVGRTPLTIRRQISEGKLRARKVGRQWRIERAELDRPGGDRNISNDTKRRIRQYIRRYADAYHRTGAASVGPAPGT